MRKSRWNCVAIRDRQARRLDARLGIVGVDVDDRDLESARQAARVRRAVFVVRAGREPELVVDDDVDRAAGVVAVEPREVQRLGDHPLAGERRVAVDQDRHAGGRIELRRTRLIDRRAGGARHADDDRIDRLEVARVRRHRDDDVHFGAALDARGVRRRGT